MEKSIATGFFWYSSRDDFDRIKSLSSDAEEMSDTFDGWLAKIEGDFASLKSRGFNVFRIHAEPGEYLAFCQANNSKVNSHSRSDFASHKLGLQLLAEREKETGPGTV